MRKYLLAGAAGLFFATSAQAEALSGARIEAIVGWDKNEIRDLGVDLGSDGVTFGLGAGYDFALGSTVSVGVDVEASDSTAEFEVSDGTTTAGLEAKRDLYAGGRVSFALSPRANVYLKAGYTNARLTGRIASGGSIVTYNGNADGVRGGAGVQFDLSGNLYLGGEYRYSNYEANYSRHQVVGVLGFRF